MSQQRHRVKQTRSLEERMAEQAANLKEQAAQLPAGKARDDLLKRAKVAETASRINDWINSPGLRPRNSPGTNVHFDTYRVTFGRVIPVNFFSSDRFSGRETRGKTTVQMWRTAKVGPYDDGLGAGLHRAHVRMQVR
ncbi:hypothetical protein [Bradyrhizobium sp. WSM1743]|uniref:hypothetical protein n=1 Tax=Bradyrhizobium sp. WSM1743 TaxID=318996 RepID=UPI003527F914